MTPSPVDLPDPGIKPGSPAFQVDSLPTELSKKPYLVGKRALRNTMVATVNCQCSVNSFDFLSSQHLPHSILGNCGLLEVFLHFFHMLTMISWSSSELDHHNFIFWQMNTEVDPSNFHLVVFTVLYNLLSLNVTCF